MKNSDYNIAAIKESNNNNEIAYVIYHIEKKSTDTARLQSG